MAADPVPVILVHGWNSHPGVWNRLIPRLDAARIPYSRFSHEKMAHESVPHIAGALRDHVRQYRDETGYDGALDTVSHSMGTCITRYWLEVMDGKEHEEHVRQLIGLGPPNNGSALAKLFHDPGTGGTDHQPPYGCLRPGGFDPEKDKIVRDVRPGSRVMAGLHNAGIRNDILDRILVTGNPEGTPSFFPCLPGRPGRSGTTDGIGRRWKGTGLWRTASPGSGYLARYHPARPGRFRAVPASCYLFCHINLPLNLVVIDRIMQDERKSPGKFWRA